MEPNSDPPSQHIPARRGSWRFRIYRQLDPSAREAGGLSLVNLVIVVCIVTASLLTILETEPVIRDRFPRLLLGLETFFAIVFSLEYTLRIYAAGEYSRYRGFRGRLRYLVSPWAVIDLLAILPFFLTMGGTNTFLLRIMRLLRILRIAKLGRYTKAWEEMAQALRTRRFELIITTSAAALILVFSASLLYLAEGEIQPEGFGSIPRSLWWSIATLTTVGYGDVVPVTPIGRFFAAVTAVAGIGLIAMPAGILAAALSDAFQRRNREAEQEK